MTQTKAELLQTRHQGDIRLGDADSSNYVGFKAPATVGSNLVWTLPATDGSPNQFLQTNASGVLGWGTADVSSAMPLTGGTFIGDVTFDGATAGRDIVFDRSDNALEFADNAKTTFGNSSDLQIYHDGTDSIIRNTTGNLRVVADNIHFEAGDFGDEFLRCNHDGAVELYYDNSKKFETSAAGISITGALTVSTNATILGNLTVSGTTTTVDSVTLSVKDKNIEMGVVSSPSDTTADGGGITLKGASDKTFNWVDSTDAWTSSEHIHLGDNKKLLVGTGSDLQLYHDGSNSYIHESGTGNLVIRTSNLYAWGHSGEDLFNAVADGAVSLYYDNVKKFETTSSGINVTGAINVNGSALSAAPEITGTASGSISNNQAVIAKTNGQIEAVTASTSVANPPTGAMISTVDTTDNSYWQSSTYDSSTNCIVVLWGGWTTFNGFKIRTGVVSENSISWGTTQTITGLNALREIHVAASGSGKLAVFMAKNSGSALYMQIASISASNKSCTFGTAVSLGGNGYSGTSGTYMSKPVWMSTSAIACGWRKGGTERGYVRTLSVSGTACTVQSEHEIANNSHQLDGQVALFYRNNKLVFLGRKIHPANNLLLKCASISGTSMTWGSVQTDSVKAYKLGQSSGTFVADNKFIVAFYDNWNENYYSRVFSISTTTIDSGGTINNFSSSSYSNWRLYWDSDISRVVMASRDTSTAVGGVQKDSVRVQMASISGTSITWGTESDLIRNTTNNSEVRETYDFIHDSTLERGLIVANSSGGSNTTYDISIFSANTTTTTTNMTADNFIGFSTAGYSNGQTATIAVVGNTTTKSSLTAGSKHYVKKDGSLSTTADTPSVEAGLALSSTKLLIKG